MRNFGGIVGVSIYILGSFISSPDQLYFFIALGAGVITGVILLYNSKPENRLFGQGLLIGILFPAFLGFLFALGGGYISQ